MSIAIATDLNKQCVLTFIFTSPVIIPPVSSLSSAAPGLFALVNIRKALIQRQSKFSRPQACSFASSSNKTLASFKSSVSKPSVNQP